MNIAVAFGQFDSMHIGHREVLNMLKTYNYPIIVCFNEKKKETVYSSDEKKYLLEKMGIKAVFNMDMETYEKTSLGSFVYEILYRRVGASTIVVGENFDKLPELKTEADKFGIRLDVVKEIKVDNQMVKKTLQIGNFGDALMLLGDNYIMAGSVAHGKGHGTKHNIPTANISWTENKLFPKFGVYATRVVIDGNTYNGVTNVGLRPSDDNNPIPTCETLILGFDKDIYDKFIVLEAFRYIRPVIKFDSLEQLREQIKKDIASVFPEGN